MVLYPDKQGGYQYSWLPSQLGQQRFFDLPSPLLLQPSSSITTLAIMDDDFDGGDSEAFSVCSSPLSDPIDTVVLEAS